MGRGDFAVGNSSINPFTPPRQMAAHAASLIALLELIQRARKEPQRAVEVGVWQSATSRWLLTAMPYLELSLVDPLLAGGEDKPWNDSFASCPQEQLDRNVELVNQCVADFAPRVRWIRDFSVPGSQQFEDGSQDCVFIDGAHDYLSVKADIVAWMPKVRAGGWLSGHDWKANGKYGKNVGQAVRDMLQEHPQLRLTIWPGKVWACRIPPYDRRNPVCPHCRFEQGHLQVTRFVLDHFERRCSSCDGEFSYVAHPSCEFHCWA